MTFAKEFPRVRYAYGVAAALLIGGSAFSIASGSAGAQVAQNAPAAMPPRGAPVSFADLAARLQPAVVNKIQGDVARVVAQPETREKLVNMGVDIAANSPAEFGTFLRSEMARYTKLVKDNNLKPE